MRVTKESKHGGRCDGMFLHVVVCFVVFNLNLGSVDSEYVGNIDRQIAQEYWPV